MTKIPKSERQVVIDRYLAMESMRDIAADYDISRTQICRIIKDAGVPRRSRRVWCNPKTRAPDTEESARLKRAYGITLDEFAEMSAVQGNRCLICETEISERPNKQTHIDHCHDTKEVRGILCGNCNRAIGIFKDKKRNLERAIIYLDCDSHEERVRLLAAIEERF